MKKKALASHGPEKYRDRLLRAAERMVDLNRPRPRGAFIKGGLAFLAVADAIIAELSEKRTR